MGNIAPQDISKQLPAWSVLTSAYTFRDAHHVLAFFASDIGAQMKKQAEDQLKIKILGPDVLRHTSGGTQAEEEDQHARGHVRHQAADAAGATRGSSSAARSARIRCHGISPRRIRRCRRGPIDGQDNPLPNVQDMKFYEVMSQIVLTSHLVAFDVLCMNQKSWNTMSPEKQRSFQAAVDKALVWSVDQHLKRESELADNFRKYGLDIYTPEIPAFRAYAQKVYLASDDAKAWAPGILDKIAAVK